MISSKDLKIRLDSPILTHELPDVFLTVEFGCARRQRHERDVVGNHQGFGHASRPDQAMACAPGMTLVEISSRWSCVASQLQTGSTKAALAPRSGQTAPNR